MTRYSGTASKGDTASSQTLRGSRRDGDLGTSAKILLISSMTSWPKFRVSTTTQIISDPKTSRSSPKPTVPFETTYVMLLEHFAHGRKTCNRHVSLNDLEPRRTQGSRCQMQTCHLLVQPMPLHWHSVMPCSSASTDHPRTRRSLSFPTQHHSWWLQKQRLRGNGLWRSHI